MDTLKFALLGFLQGLTELLPISSSAHLILFSKILDIEMDTYLLSVLHLGTTIALIAYFYNILFKNIFTKKKISIYLKILISTIPAGIMGLLFESVIEEKLRGNIFIALSLIIWGIVMILVERRKEPNEKDFEKITWKQSLIMGLSQIFALIPGGSRSGISTIFGMFTGLNKYTAIQYSFLLGLPLLVATPLYQIFNEYPERILNINDIFGIFIAGVITYLCLIILKRYSKKNWLTFFGIYRILLGILLLFFQS
jgi:undecaprenyl-diphosphatase